MPTQSSCQPQPEPSTPAEHNPQLLGHCRFDVDSAGDRWLVAVLEPGGRRLAVAASRRRACVMAEAVLRSEQLTPADLNPLLAGMRFGRGALDRFHVIDATGRLRGVGLGQSQAAEDAVRDVLRGRPPHALALSDFSRLCTVLTAQVVRGASGRAKNGPRRLAPVEGVPAVREFLAHCWRSERGDPGATVPLPWLAERLERVLNQDGVPPEDAQHTHLEAHGEFLIVRTPEAPHAQRCIRLLHEALGGLTHRHGAAPHSPSSSPPRARG